MGSRGTEIEEKILAWILIVIGSVGAILSVAALAAFIAVGYIVFKFIS